MPASQVVRIKRGDGYEMPTLQKDSINEKTMGFRASLWVKGEEYWPVWCLRLALVGLSFPSLHLESVWRWRREGSFLLALTLYKSARLPHSPLCPLSPDQNWESFGISEAASRS